MDRLLMGFISRQRTIADSAKPVGIADLSQTFLARNEMGKALGITACCMAMLRRSAMACTTCIRRDAPDFTDKPFLVAAALGVFTLQGNGSLDFGAIVQKFADLKHDAKKLQTFWIPSCVKTKSWIEKPVQRRCKS